LKNRTPVDAGGRPMSAETDIQVAGAAPNGAGTKAKGRQKPITRFPLQFHFAISRAMNNSILRLTAGNSLLAAADIGRLALHNYLLANDPGYQREIGNG
jgi:DNA-binding FadR family transcriptional regulator